MEFLNKYIFSVPGNFNISLEGKPVILLSHLGNSSEQVDMSNNNRHLVGDTVNTTKNS